MLHLVRPENSSRRSAFQDHGGNPQSLVDLQELDAAMDRYAGGDDRAFAAVFRGLAPRVRRFLERLGTRSQSLDDVMQETFLRLHRARRSFGEGRNVLPWAYAIARHCHVDHLRSLSREPTSKAESADFSADIAVRATAEDEVATKRNVELVERALSSMTRARRDAFLLTRYEGLSLADSAKRLGVSKMAVKLRAFYASELLRRALTAA